MIAYFKAEDEIEAKRLAKSLDMALALFKIRELKNHCEEIAEIKNLNVEDTIEMVFEEIQNIMYDRNIYIDDFLQ